MTDEFDNLYLKCKKEAENAFIKTLRENLPEIQKLESLEELTNLKLTDVISAEGVAVTLSYKAKSDSLYPNIKEGLIKSGVAEENNIFLTSKVKKGAEEFVTTHLNYYGARLQIVLDVYKE